MAMNVDHSSEDDDVVASINTTPLVDVMLVLLIIFLITIPVVTHTVPVELPKARNLPLETKPENINLSVDRQGVVYWNDKSVGNNDSLLARLKTVSAKVPQPVVQIRGDGNAPYEFVGRVVLACQRAGIVKLGFITEPPARQ
jgi:biopolymer transport protein ExbD